MSEPDRYQLVRTIASGGMGQVYEATAHGHRGFSRRVAIKRLLPELLGNDEARRLFREEARIASHLHHGNIVQVLDYGVVDGAEFLVLEYIDGIDANQLLTALGRPLAPAIAAHVAAEIGHALGYAHDRRDRDGAALGIVHRDVTTQNILLSWGGDVKLSDFGIALAVARDARTRTGVVKGKLGYLAPEQLRGDRATPAADVYALGVTLHVLVTGELPGGASATPTADLAALVARSLAAAPTERPSAVAFAREAARFAGGVGRTELAELLTSVRSRSDRRSALDDLMGMALVPAAEGGFTVERAAAPAAAPAPAAAAPADHAAAVADASRLEADTVPAAAGRRGGIGRRLALGLALLAAVGATAVVLGRAVLSGDEPAAHAGLAADARLAAASTDAARVAAAPTDAARSGPAPSPPPAMVDAAPARPRDRGRSRRDARGRRTIDAPEPRAVSPRARGWLRVGGAALLKAAVQIDGVDRGFAPHAYELTEGLHRVVVRDAIGKTLVDTTVTVEPRHTRGEPIKILR